jgi:aminoglycoside 3-N-acetyltransferase
MRYQKHDISVALNDIDLHDAKVVSIKTDLRYFGRHDFNSSQELLESFYEAICEKIDLHTQTIVVATNTLALCNTDIPFDIENSKSEMGALTEYIRLQPGAVRSNHPFASYTAIGKDAGYICHDNSMHAYGPNSPKSRMLELGAQYLCLGVHPYDSTTAIHHAEFLSNVPYRYVKEFLHPILINGVIKKKPFYMHVMDNQYNIVRNLEKKIYPNFFAAGFNFQEVDLGQGKIYSFSMNDFFEIVISTFKNDLYAYVETPILEKK